jgi:hypothetical protein
MCKRLNTDPKFTPLAAEWAEVVRGLDNLQQVELFLQGSRFLLRSQLTSRGGSRPATRAPGNRLKRLAPRRSQMCSTNTSPIARKSLIINCRIFATVEDGSRS